MSIKKITDNLIVFQNVPNVYPASEDVEVKFWRQSEVTAKSRDWIGLFPFGWTTTKQYYTFEWAPMPSRGQEGCDMKVLFSGRRLPREDGQQYQFCYIGYSGELYGSSVPFQFVEKGNYRREAIPEAAPEETLHESASEVSSSDDAAAKNETNAKDSFQPHPSGDSDDDLIVIESLQRDLASSIERQKVTEAECEKLRQQSTSTKEALDWKKRETQIAREQMEDLVKKLSTKIDVLEERLLEKQRICENDMEVCSQQLAAENSELNRKLSLCIAEVKKLENKLQHEEDLRKKLEQQLVGFEADLRTAKGTPVLQEGIHNVSNLADKINSKSAITANEIDGSRDTKVLGCNATAVKDLSAIEALQVAYGAIEKHYHTATAELEACQMKLKETEKKVQVLEQQCIQLQMKEDCKAQTQMEPSTAQYVKELEQRLKQSEYTCGLLTDREKQYKRKIEEMEQQLLEHKKTFLQSADSNEKLEHERILQQLREIAENLLGNKADSDMKDLLRELEKVVTLMNSKNGISKVDINVSSEPDNQEIGFQQCPVCKKEFPKSMPQKNFQRHVLKHKKRNDEEVIDVSK